MSDLDDKDFAVRAPYVQKIIELEQDNEKLKVEVARLGKELLIRMNDRETAKQRAGNFESALYEVMAREVKLIAAVEYALFDNNEETFLSNECAQKLRDAIAK